MRRTSFGIAASVVGALGLAAACGSGDDASTTDGFKNNVGGAGVGVGVSVSATVGAGAGATTSVTAAVTTTGSNTSTTGSNTTASTGSSTGGGSGGIFKASEPWNTPVDGDMPDPASGDIITSLTNAGGWGTGNLQIDFSITLQHADASTPMMPFVKSGDFYSPDCDDIGSFPVPNGGAIEGETGYGCQSDGDCHLLVVDDANNKLYEMYRAFAPPDPTTFNGGCAVVWDLTKAYPANLRGDGCTSVDAGGFPVAAMLFTADEVAAGSIDHAIRFILPNARIRGGDVYVHPGTHTTSATSGDSNAPPYGVRFRLKPMFDTSSLSGGAKVVANALKKYGMFLSDGGNIALTAADDRFSTAKWADVDLDSHGLQSLQVGDFEVVDMGATIPYTDDCVRNP